MIRSCSCGTKCALSTVLLVAIAGCRLAGGGEAADDRKKMLAKAVKVAVECRRWIDAACKKGHGTGSFAVWYAKYMKSIEAYRAQIRAFGDAGLEAMEQVGLDKRAPCLNKEYWGVYTSIAVVDIPIVGKPRVVALLRANKFPLTLTMEFISSYTFGATHPATWVPEDLVFDLLTRLLAETKTDHTKWGIYTLASPRSAPATAVSMRGCDYVPLLLSRWYGVELGWRSGQKPADSQARDAAVARAKTWIAKRKRRFHVKEALFLILEHHGELGVSDAERLQKTCGVISAFVEHRGDLRRLVAIYLAELTNGGKRKGPQEDARKALMRAVSGLVRTFLRKSGAVKLEASPDLAMRDEAVFKKWLLKGLEECKLAAKGWHDRYDWEMLKKEIGLFTTPAK
jgi:hypothetical protein